MGKQSLERSDPDCSDREQTVISAPMLPPSRLLGVKKRKLVWQTIRMNGVNGEGGICDLLSRDKQVSVVMWGVFILG